MRLRAEDRRPSQVAGPAPPSSPTARACSMTPVIRQPDDPGECLTTAAEAPARPAPVRPVGPGPRGRRARSPRVCSRRTGLRSRRARRSFRLAAEGGDAAQPAIPQTPPNRSARAGSPYAGGTSRAASVRASPAGAPDRPARQRTRRPTRHLHGESRKRHRLLNMRI